MKERILVIAVTSLLAGMAGNALAQQQGRFRDAASHDGLVALSKKARSERIDPVTLLKPSEGEDPSVVHRPEDLVSRSDVLCFNGYATLVPKRALIRVPAMYQSRMGIQEGARIVPFREFLVRNRGWIECHEVNRSTAEGKTPFDAETLERFSKKTRVVVATMLGGPISVIDPKTLEPEPEVVSGETDNTNASLSQ